MVVHEVSRIVARGECYTPSTNVSQDTSLLQPQPTTSPSPLIMPVKYADDRTLLVEGMCPAIDDGNGNRPL
jgi:hypothetical protein